MKNLQVKCSLTGNMFTPDANGCAIALWLSLGWCGGHQEYDTVTVVDLMKAGF